MKKITKIIIPSILVVAAISAFFVFSKNNKTTENPEYTTINIEKGDIESYIEGDGKIISDNELEIKPEVSSKINKIYVTNGQKVKKGELLVELDSSDISKMVRDNKLALEQAKISYENLKNTQSLSIAQAESSFIQSKDSLEKLKLSQKNTYDQANEAKTNTSNSLENSYISAINFMDLAYADFATSINDFRKILYLSETIINQDITNDEENNKNLLTPDQLWNLEIPKYWKDIITSTNFDSVSDKEYLESLAKNATLSFLNAKNIYSKNFLEYQTLNKFSDKDFIEIKLKQAQETSKYMVESSRNLNNLYDFWINYNNERKRTLYYNIANYNVTLKSDSAKINSHLNNLISADTGTFGINTLKISLANALRNIEQLELSQPLDLALAEKNVTIQEENYKRVKQGLDIKSQEIILKQRQNALSDSEEKLEDYFITAPFDGVVGDILAKEGSSASPAFQILKIITNQKLAEVSINEFDATKIKLSQKTELTFNAIDDLKIEGEVVEINVLPSLDQSGVVNYKIKISFDDKQDERIKSGMNVYAKIILDKKTNTYLIKSSAINENRDGQKYIEILNNDNSISERNIETGLENNEYYEVLSSVDESQKIILRTKKKTPQSGPFSR